MAQNILDWLQGSFAKTVATIAVIIVGFMFFTGRASMQLFVTVVIAIFIVFSAGWIVDQITGGALTVAKQPSYRRRRARGTECVQSVVKVRHGRSRDFAGSWSDGLAPSLFPAISDR